jgi:drug/metabolite transporter (DMT)-like permease
MCCLETLRATWRWKFTADLADLIIAVMLLLAKIRTGNVARVSALFFLVPPLAALLVWVMFGQGIPAAAWVGVGIAASGVYLATRG